MSSPGPGGLSGQRPGDRDDRGEEEREAERRRHLGPPPGETPEIEGSTLDPGPYEGREVRGVRSWWPAVVVLLIAVLVGGMLLAQGITLLG
ncbi:DUF6480 family protein [Allostreptomyces psammosilenae]|uniref:Uncharacterized protein n=1 Tax=Allostreptomyces psammosilenae TaxID=1892865 RepID=A0A852ZRN5_9ACTN|nr:DUF6480 family protein [Allostreptomyces psammosilenae]NYI04137.1 hypothetical protein [Allostreptomyces psammosilenae]